MEKKDFLKKYAYYSEIIRNIGEIPLKKNITLSRDTGISKKEIQMAYNDIEKYNFEGSILDYLCWLSTLQIVYHALQGVGKKGPSFNLKIEACFLNANLTGEEEILTLHNAFFLATEAPQNEVNKKNMLRLWAKNPEVLFNSMVKLTEELKKNMVEILVLLISMIYQDSILRELLHKNQAVKK